MSEQDIDNVKPKTGYQKERPIKEFLNKDRRVKQTESTNIFNSTIPSRKTKIRILISEKQYIKNCNFTSYALKVSF